jgi:hypothetical protein
MIRRRVSGLAEIASLDIPARRLQDPPMPLRGTDAKRLIRRLLECGVFAVSRHAREEMGKDNLTDVDAVNVLRAGIVDEAEFEHGSWRYRVRTGRMLFVVAFDPEVDALPDDAADVGAMELVVVTAWRIKP